MVRLSAVLTVVVIAAVACGSSSQMAFSPKKWRDDRAERYRMVDDLTRRHLYRGAPQKPLFRILGWPDGATGTDYTYSRRWAYCLRWVASDCAEGLFIYFKAPSYQRVDHASARSY